jgi:acetoin utilization protein AcuC
MVTDPKMHETAFVYSDKYLSYDFGGFHPMRPERLKLTERLCVLNGLLAQPEVSVRLPRQATETELLSVHSREHVALVRRLSESGVGLLDAGDTPAFKGMFEAGGLWAGGSLLAAEMVGKSEVEHAFNIGGGLHHAGRDRASGFCVFNDVAMAAKHLIDDLGFERVFMLDIDAHHGDGTQEILYEEPRCLKVDFHESGRYLFPGSGFSDEIGAGKGRGFMVNIPLPPYTYDEEYLRVFDEVVPPLVEAFQPQVILQQTGADAHRSDGLTTMGLTTHAYEEVVKRMHALSHKYCKGKYILLGGGGYSVEAVSRIWTLALSEIIDCKLDGALPEEWIREFSRLAKGTPPRNLRDATYLPDEAACERIHSEVEAALGEIKRSIFPMHNIR